MSGTLKFRKRRRIGSRQHYSASAIADKIDGAKMLKARETQRFLIALAQFVKALAQVDQNRGSVDRRRWES
jgi:hypothetical protein